jgi:hypothetical protein
MEKTLLKFEDPLFDKFLLKMGILSIGMKLQFVKVLFLFVICWVPPAIMTLVNDTFWTGDITNSFITSFDTQVRFFISMPIFIMAQSLISSRLQLVIAQFKKSGIVLPDEHSRFDSLVDKHKSFLNSKWTNIILLLICYAQIIAVLFYTKANTAFIAWQFVETNGEPTLNTVGFWITFISRPLTLFILYKWLLRILVWGNLLRKISNLNIRLFPEHPDLAGGLGFLGYSLRYFSPITFAISASVAGNMADFMLIEGLHITDLKLYALGYYIFILLLFILPFFSFTEKMDSTKENSVYENNDFANGMYIELHLKISKRFDQVTQEDLDTGIYSSVADYNAIMSNVINMKFLPFTLKDIIPIFVSTAIPFFAIVLLEIPFAEIFNGILTVLI